LSRIHGLNFTLIEIVIVAHIVAILTYAVLKRHDLVRPMITGRKHLPEWMTPPHLVSPLRALVLFVIAISAVSVFVNVL
jgi:tryptophan-rich sensory protein